MCHMNKVVLADEPSSVPINSPSSRAVVAASMLA